MLRDDEKLFMIFIEDLLEQISYMDASLLAVERANTDSNALTNLFRVFHSTKGLFFTMEYQALGEFLHRLETIVQSALSSKMPITQSYLDLVIEFKGSLETYVAALKSDKLAVFDLQPYDQWLKDIEEDLLDPNLLRGPKETTVPPRQLLYEALKRTELIYLQMIDNEHKLLEPKLLMESFNTCRTYSEPLTEKHLQSLFQCAVKFLSYYVEKNAHLDHLAEGLIMETFDWAMKLIDLTKQLSPEDERNFMVHLDMMQAQRIMYLQQLSDDNYNADSNGDQKLGEILVKQGKVKEDEIAAIINKQKAGDIALKLGEALVSENIVRVKDIAGALQVQTKKRKETDGYTFIRIPERKVDVLVDGMEELMIMQSQLKEKLKKRWLEGDVGTKLQLDRIDRMLILLQHQAMSFRMQTLENTLQKAELIGRSTAKDLGKELEFELDGSTVEANRSIVERLQNPILHLVRNAIYHGIEEPEVRRALGKPEKGLLSVSGYLDKSSLTVTISDDGRGLDQDKILNRALQLGLADKEKQYAAWEIVDFIFEPGFSTLDESDSVSGRGLGMNIVETEVKALGGHIEIQNKPGLGVSFMLKIPLHMENLLGLLVEIGDEKLIVPSESVQSIMKGKQVEWVIASDKCERIVIGKEVINLIPIGTLLEQTIDMETLMHSEILILQLGNAKRALPVKHVLKEMGVFVNQLDEFKEEGGLFKGVSVINDHEFALILDTEKIFSV